MFVRLIASTVLASGAAVGLLSTTISLTAQSAQTTAARARSSPAIPRTEDGRPSLMGVWAYGTITPFERPVTQTKTELTDAERAAAEESARTRRNFDDRTGAGTRADVERAYNDFWWDPGSRVAGNQTSLVVDPPDGRIPPTTPEYQKLVQERQAARIRPTSEADNPEDRSLWERCIGRAIPYQSGPYNNNIQIVQTKDHVVIVNEMIHEARIIPTDGRPHGKVRKWHGDSVGRWDGDTLVVETINFSDKMSFRGANLNLKLTERFRRGDANTLIYEYTVEDPTTWTRPWTVRQPMTFNPEGIFEYACHEANYGLEGILKGARHLEREGAGSQAPAARPPAALPPAR